MICFDLADFDRRPGESTSIKSGRPLESGFSSTYSVTDLERHNYFQFRNLRVSFEGMMMYHQGTHQ